MCGQAAEHRHDEAVITNVLLLMSGMMLVAIVSNIESIRGMSNLATAKALLTGFDRQWPH
jgi:hypothetical protein